MLRLSHSCVSRETTQRSDGRNSIAPLVTQLCVKRGDATLLRQRCEDEIRGTRCLLAKKLWLARKTFVYLC